MHFSVRHRPRAGIPGEGEGNRAIYIFYESDINLLAVELSFTKLPEPRVPGHEVVGRIDALGSGVARWKIGQRVGVGLVAGEDGECVPCRRGDTVNCQNAVVSGVNSDGGYAEVMIAEARGIASIPDELSSIEAAPLMCAGITT